MYLAIQASQTSSSSCAPPETWLVAPAVCRCWTQNEHSLLSFLHRTSASCTASSAGSPSPRRKRIKVQPPPLLWYDLCSSDQRLEPVRIQMLCRAAFFFFFPHLDPQTMMSDPVLLPRDPFGLPDWFNQESFFFFFPHSPWSLRQLCPLSPPIPPVHSSRIECDALVPSMAPQSSSLLLILPVWVRASPRAATGGTWQMCPPPRQILSHMSF